MNATGKFGVPHRLAIDGLIDVANRASAGAHHYELHPLKEREQRQSGARGQQHHWSEGGELRGFAFLLRGHEVCRGLTANAVSYGGWRVKGYHLYSPIGWNRSLCMRFIRGSAPDSARGMDEKSSRTSARRPPNTPPAA